MQGLGEDSSIPAPGMTGEDSLIPAPGLTGEPELLQPAHGDLKLNPGMGRSFCKGGQTKKKRAGSKNLTDLRKGGHHRGSLKQAYLAQPALLRYAIL